MTDTTNQPLIDAVANLIKVKGRFHTEQAYKQLVEAYDAAIEASRTPAAQEVSDAEILKLFYKEHGEGFALYEVTPGNMIAFARALLALAAAPKVPDGWQAVFLPDGWSTMFESMVCWARKAAPEVEKERIDLFYRDVCTRPLSAAPSSPSAPQEGSTELEKDAARYRYLLDGAYSTGTQGWLREFKVVQRGSYILPDELKPLISATIDAAIAAAPMKGDAP